MKIILFGGSGTLGKELQKLTEVICPSHTHVDVTDAERVLEYILFHKPDLIINAAAVIDNRVLEKTPEKAISTNIIGAANIANACIKHNIRLVYVSTDYIYKGDRGNYKETDEILPFNFYAWTKLGGECSTQGVKNHLIIRVTFGKSEFSYPQAFIDKWSSKDYIDIIAPLIYEASISPLTGILNLGTDRKTLHSHAIERNPDVIPVKLSETAFFTPYDTSFNLQKWFDFKGSKSVIKTHTNCRACGSNKLFKYLDLGLMPLPNNLEISSLAGKSAERFPLQVMFCSECSLSQLSVVVDPSKLFSYYTYRSSINGGYITHCKEMAQDLKANHFIPSNGFIVDIAGNDGALLKQFKEEFGPDLRVLNVDPANNLVAIAEAQGIPCVADFWSKEVAEKIEKTHGKADVITATNVFAHVDDIKGFLEAAKLLLKDDGVLVIECPYLIDFIENVEFDTIYHEHLSYMSIGPIDTLCENIDLRIIDVQKQNIHGGTVRISITNKSSIRETDFSVYDFLEDEIVKGYKDFSIYLNWSRSVNKTIEQFSNGLMRLKRDGKKICGFSASAKGNTLLNSAIINTDVVDYIVDETPEKIGKFSPGTGIPIVHKQELIKNPPDFLIILSWNFKEEIMKKCRELGFKGKFIIPIPEFQIID